MKKRLVAVLISGLMAASMMTACGGAKSATSSAASTTASSEAEEATSEAASEATSDVEEEEAASEATSEAESTATGTGATANVSDISFVDGYYANDGNGNDLMIAFYENAPGDVAYISDGTNEALAEYKVENAQSDDGMTYQVITIGNTQLGYLAEGPDGNPYLFDEDGNTYKAAKLSEEEADQIYEAMQNAANAEVDSSAESASDVQYVDGYYANDGNGSDFMIAFFTSSVGDVAYVSDGENEVLAEYSTEDAQLDDGTAYTKVTVGNAVMGYYKADDGTIYIVDDEGNTYAAGQLSQEEAAQLYQMVTQQQ